VRTAAMRAALLSGAGIGALLVALLLRTRTAPNRPAPMLDGGGQGGDEPALSAVETRARPPAPALVEPPPQSLEGPPPPTAREVPTGTLRVLVHDPWDRPVEAGRVLARPSGSRSESGDLVATVNSGAAELSLALGVLHRVEAFPGAFEDHLFGPAALD